jgi:hypothetical protein
MSNLNFKSMQKKKVEGMKCSEILRIEAAMMEKAEKVASDVEIDSELMPAKTEGKLMMTIRFPKLSLDGIFVLREELTGFSVEMFGKGKSGFFIAVVGSLDAFKKLILPVATQSQYQYNRSS